MTRLYFLALLIFAWPATVAAERAKASPSKLLPTASQVGGNPFPYVLYVQTYDGRIQILRGFTKEACERSRKRAMGEPVTDEEAAAAAMFDKTRCTEAGQSAKVCARPDHAHISSDVLQAMCLDKPLP